MAYRAMHVKNLQPNNNNNNNNTYAARTSPGKHKSSTRFEIVCKTYFIVFYAA